ncbi:MAG: hypothetical protein RLZZ176_2264 [Cyanobacteriota bacterium]
MVDRGLEMLTNLIKGEMMVDLELIIMVDLELTI